MGEEANDAGLSPVARRILDAFDFMPGRAAARAAVPIEVASALSRAAHDHLNRLGMDCPHDIGLVLADALAPFWNAPNR